MGGGWNRGVRWSEAVGEAVLAGTRAGKTLAEVCVGPDMPSMRAVVRWTRQKPAFGLAMRRAREAAGLGFGRGLPSTYDEETALAICERLCAGERVKDITADPDMPGYSTYFRWQKDIPEFRRAVALAREICALRLAEEGWEDACAVTPQTAFATRVKLEHLRWYAGKLSPRKYGPLSALPPEGFEPLGRGAGRGAGGEATRLNISITEFERSSSGKVMAIPPRCEKDEQLYLETYGRPYDGPDQGKWRRLAPP